MRENRPYGSEGGAARAVPTPIVKCRGVSGCSGVVKCRASQPQRNAELRSACMGS
jgi:hypothetical protein